MIELLEKRAIDATVEDIALAVVSMIKSEEKPPSEYVGKDERNSILLANSDSKANSMMKWGKDNDLDVRKVGQSSWNREDLEALRDGYAEGC